MAHNHIIYPATPPTAADPSLYSPLQQRPTSLPPSPSSPVYRPTPRPPPPPSLVQQKYIPEEPAPAAPDGPLFLSIDAAQKKLRACLLDDKLQVMWVEQVEVDTELAEYG